MPIYEYQCQACDERVEVLQKISDAPKVDCPACNKPELKKKVSAVAFRLKGSGWYETDFKTGDKKNLAGDKQAKTSSGEKAAPAKKTETKTDSKKSSTA
jgi:putative FmdB family regulatory protein